MEWTVELIEAMNNRRMEVIKWNNKYEDIMFAYWMNNKATTQEFISYRDGELSKHHRPFIIWLLGMYYS